ncbi:hypothetical protein [Streptomyces shenzhenensis]|uniref:hypothetical protein n=1 Tax=Streptomyces shenzhenensis TaxID=943815 RepID=UPI001F21DB59|nr:hypothetical protein [Streptomyces shenzhenensis]
MRKFLALAAAATVLTAGLVGCSSNAAPANATSPKAAAAQAKPLTARIAFDKVSAIVSTAKLSGTVTADNDPNHLLGRPNQYTSKITFDDTRISADDVSGTDKGDVDRGGAIEVFGSPADAQARAKYILSVTKSLPMLSEYDYVHGAAVVRVSHYLTPKQAADYKSAANNLG